MTASFRIIHKHALSLSLSLSISISWFDRLLACLFVLLTLCITHAHTHNVTFCFLFRCCCCCCIVNMLFTYLFSDSYRWEFTLFVLCYVICGVFSFSSCLRSKIKRPEYEQSETERRRRKKLCVFLKNRFAHLFPLLHSQFHCAVFFRHSVVSILIALIQQF